MLGVDQANWAALVFALAAATLLGGPKWTTEGQPKNARVESGVEVSNAGGNDVRTAGYTRIVSLSSIADQVLLEILEPARWIAVSDRAQKSLYAHRVSDKVVVSDRVDVEHLLSLRPDLVFAHRLGGKQELHRLIEHGVKVVDLGPMAGVQTLLKNIELIGSVVGQPERASNLARDFEERLRRVHNGQPMLARALYLGIHGGSVFGGTKGSSYHDVIVHAGLEDAAATDYDGWPRYTSEQVLMLDPDFIVSHEGGRQRLCSDGILSHARVCGQPGGVLIIPRRVLNDPGLLMLEATEELRRQLDLALRERSGAPGTGQ